MFTRLFFGNPGKSFVKLINSKTPQNVEEKHLIISDQKMHVNLPRTLVRDYAWLKNNLSDVNFEELIISTRLDLLCDSERHARLLLLRQILERKSVTVTFLSSIAVYGTNCASISKETPVHPITNYGIQKLEFEDFLSQNQGKNKLLIIRFTNLMNFKDENSLPLKIFNEMVKPQIGKELVLSETRDLIYYREAVDATNRVIRKIRNEEVIEKKVLIMGSGVSIFIPKLVELFRDSVKNLDEFCVKTSYTHPIPRVSIQTDNWCAAYGKEFRQYTEEELVESTLKNVHYRRDRYGKAYGDITRRKLK